MPILPPMRTPMGTAYSHNVLDPSSFALDHCGYYHIEVYNGPVQRLMGNSPHRHSNVTLEHLFFSVNDPNFFK